MTYVHRIGRTARAGKKGNAVTFVDWDDVPRWKLICDELELPFHEPVETYSTSPHLYLELDIPETAKGTLPRSERTRAGLDAEEFEDLGGRDGGATGPAGRRAQPLGPGPAAARALGAPRARRASGGGNRTRTRTRGGRPVEDGGTAADSRRREARGDGGAGGSAGRNRRRRRGGRGSGTSGDAAGGTPSTGAANTGAASGGEPAGQ